jgi:DHA2 family multidrug resistance protein
MSHYNLAISPAWIVWPSVLQGFGMGAVFVPLSTMAYASLDPKQADAGAGLFNLARTIGAAMGVSVAATLYTRFGQMNWNQLGGHINPFNPALQDWLQATGLKLSDPQTPGLLAHELSSQASMLAFTQVFEVIALSFLAMAPLLFFLRDTPDA